jgi:hypothetical protein
MNPRAKTACSHSWTNSSTKEHINIGKDGRTQENRCESTKNTLTTVSTNTTDSAGYDNSSGDSGIRGGAASGRDHMAAVRHGRSCRNPRSNERLWRGWWERGKEGVGLEISVHQQPKGKYSLRSVWRRKMVLLSRAEPDVAH